MGNNLLSSLRGEFPSMKSLLFSRGQIDLHAMVTSVGFEECRDRGYDWHGRKRGASPFFLVQHTLDGQGRLRYDGREYPVKTGDTMILQFPDDNRYWLPRDQHWTFFWVCINGREALRILSRVLQQNGPLVKLNDQSVSQLAEHCRDVINGRCATAGQASAMAYSVAMILTDDLNAQLLPQPSQRHPGLQRAIGFIRNNLREPLSVQQLSEIAGYSPYHFSRLFKEAESLSPAKFVQRERLTKAVRLMQTGTDSVKTVSRVCGFSDPNYFAKAFRSAYGLSPTEFMQAPVVPKVTQP